MTPPLPDTVLRGRIGAYTRWARTEDRVAATQPARSAFMRRFEEKVDPEGLLSDEERVARAHFAMRAHMADLARRRVRSRRRKRGATLP